MNIYLKYKDLAGEVCKRLFGLTDEDLVNVVAEPPKDSSHGDIAINAAMVLVKKLKQNPRQTANQIKVELENISDVESVEIAGPGFLNLRIKISAWYMFLQNMTELGESYGFRNIGKGKKFNVEYVSVNPTGPVHIGHVRNAVIGDSIANILKKCGYDVAKEYYINDAGAQIDVLSKSAFLRYKQALGMDIGEIPEGLYPGDYLIKTGEKFAKIHGEKFLNDDSYPPELKQFCVDEMMELIKADLLDLGIEHDVFFSEKTLHEQGKIAEAISFLEGKGLLYKGILEPPKGKLPDDWEEREQLLFKATDFGDDVDRPLQKSNGEYTYFASDIAYHKNKIDRGFNDMAITLGADHGGYVKRLKAAVKALSNSDAQIEPILGQMITLSKNGKPFKMSKRSGSFVTLRDVLDAVGKDVLRFIMLTRKADAGLDFDLHKVKEATKENPVFYVQYAHARICSVLRQLDEKNIKISDNPDLSFLKHDAELATIKKISEFPKVVEASAVSYEPHRITFYLYDLASQFHHLWSLGKDDEMKFIVEDNLELTSARIYLINSVKTLIKSGLELLGVEAVEKM